ncbi:hypothetical protein [Acidithiobacillus ferriphilus]|uniref:Prepilin type IV endopeptidase peptidase domain-containing protein n=3 Tax=Acidithiobacillus ferriphilus TaxID=1689834 RepID=A0ABU6FTL0_9PROT|nr:hypothetical protein [Acidithiobacillus ferriphilus]MEB8488008.1 hypothetical protein [Acidithiobacillus ferriphilus]MEB8489413.1 hypothetical protein [Acidithiobacillus ferriphilus]MEB8493636.1 hypothetical protein [Acidithiobacillus ferriphilus]MEB8515387.1 hypothetical protein [Acidithiobacillus ferriphilus]MEB8534010.1 hypothetical protein [Acidithiobacillus ferriphilus]
MWNLWQSSFVRSLILDSALFPAAVTMLMVVAAYYKTRKYPSWHSTFWAAAILAGFLVGYALTYRDFSFPPRTVLSWLPWLALVGGTVVAIADHRRYQWWRYGARGLIAGASAFVLLWPILRQETVPAAFLAWLTVAMLWSVLWFALTPDNRDQKPAGTTLFVGAVGLALVAPLLGSILLAQFGTALAVVLAVALVFSLLMRGSRWDSPSADVGVLILGNLMVDLRFYAGASMVVMGWLLVSLAAGAVVAGILQHRGHSGHWTVLAPGLISSLPMAVAGWMALQTYLASGGGY